MGDRSGIQWTDATWNPVRGCSRVSAGCMNCYAERQAIRQIKTGYAGLIQRTSHGPAWTGEVRFMDELLDQPLRWRTPRRVFVNSMSDLFHEHINVEDLASVFAYMGRAHWHTFQVLTKRPEQMHALLNSDDFRDVYESVEHVAQHDAEEILARRGDFSVHKRRRDDIRSRNFSLPLPNVHLGVSVENQETADQRIPLLLQTPAAVRFVSYEPALGPVDFTCFKRQPSDVDRALEGNERVQAYWANPLTGVRGVLMKDGRVLDAPNDIGPRLDWLIVGGESGPGARECFVDWIRRAVEQCRAAGVPCFVKQMGANVTLSADEMERMTGVRTMPHRWNLKDRKGGEPAEWPEDLRAREFPL
jgi:protein gp37